MENSGQILATRRSSNDSSKRSIKPRRPRSSKTSRDSKNSRIMDIKEEQVSTELLNINYRQSITNSFFESFYSSLVVETKSVKTDSLSSITLVNPGDSPEDSYISVLDSASSKAGSTHSKDMSFPKPSLLSSQSMAESTSTNISCSSNCTCCWKVVFKNGNIYEGTLHDNLMDGKGIFYWNDGSVYRGEFKDGYPCGLGKLTFPDLSTYEGTFSMGFFHGFGTINIKSSPILYSGEWRVSKRNGKGWMLYESNNWYEGDFVDNKKHGYGQRHYDNGDTYMGSWLNDQISGEGSMIWHNNDYYTGAWSNGCQHGYGEYTWNLVAHNSFVFPNYNWYKGNWVDGQRTGAGIMYFGYGSGAKLAGIWHQNKKDGPGAMICGNGVTIESNPLFTGDKPATFQKGRHTPSAKGDGSSDSSDKKESSLKSFHSISRHIESKENLYSLNVESLTNITESSVNIQMKQFIKLLEPQVSNTPPLKIPIHNLIHEIDWDYFIADFFRPRSLGKDALDVSTMEIEHMIEVQEGSYLTPSCMNYLPSNADLGTNNITTSASQHCLPNTNELKNLIINYLPQLRSVYKKYACICAEQQSLSFEPVLIRFFLWQLYRDIGVTDKGGISIIEVDEMLFRNPNSCLETSHSPWEPIYFWQFLQALVGVACMLFTNENHLDYTPSSGFMYFMFKNFLDHKLFASAGIYQGNCLTHLKDLIPVEDVYNLYKDTGEPHTVKGLLKNIFLAKGQSMPCYKFINNENSCEFTVPIGTNIVVLNKELSYLEKTRTKVNLEDDNKQKLYQGLYAFSCLGRKKILQSLYKICPQLLLSSGKYNLNYRLSFIEFYEALLLLAFEKVEQERLQKLAEEEIRACSMSDIKSTSIREISRSIISTKGKKKKK